jgi:hypothetical protein
MPVFGSQSAAGEQFYCAKHDMLVTQTLTPVGAVHVGEMEDGQDYPCDNTHDCRQCEHARKPDAQASHPADET